jgi:hypothetical protein
MELPTLQDAMPYPSGNGVVTAGVCLEPFASMINHSCDPNSWWTFNGREFQLRAVRDILAGEELTASYIGISGCYKFRQQSLMNGWGFQCRCLLCEMGTLGPTEGPICKKLREIQRLEQASHDGTFSRNLLVNFIYLQTSIRLCSRRK